MSSNSAELLATKLRWQWLIPALFLVSGSQVLLWVMQTNTAAHSVDAIAARNLKLQSNALGTSIAQLLDETQRDTKIAASLDVVAEVIESGEAKNAQQYLDTVRQNNRRYRLMIIADELGEVVASNSITEPEAFSLQGEQIGDFAWVKDMEATEVGAAQWVTEQRPTFLHHMLKPNERVFGYAVPVFDLMDERIGMIVFFVSTDFLQTLLSSETASGQLESFSALYGLDNTLIELPNSMQSLQVRYQDFRSESTEVGPWRAVMYQAEESLQAPARVMARKLLIVTISSLFFVVVGLFIVTLLIKTKTVSQ